MNWECVLFFGVTFETMHLKLMVWIIHTSADLTGQANHLGVTLQADIIKQKMATNNGGYQCGKIWKNIATWFMKT